MFMVIRKLRLNRGWSQDQLAQLSGLSIRTIQRIERGQNPGLETLKSLAAVFEVQIDDLKQETTMTNEEAPSEETRAIKYVRDIKCFYSHLTTYVLVISGLFAANFIFSPEYIWAKWTAMGWGIGLISHGLNTFEVLNLFSPAWEKKQIEKRLGRKL